MIAVPCASRITSGSKQGWGTGHPRRPPALHRSAASGTKKVKFAEATNTLPIVAESYRKWHVAALEEDTGASGAEDEPWDDVDLTTYDEATVAALYEELQDFPRMNRIFSRDSR